MKSEFKTLLPIILISIVNYLIWVYFKTPLNDENLQLTGPISDLSTSWMELLKYAIISFFISLNIVLPFYLRKSFSPKLPYWVGITILTITFWLAAYLLDHNAKGIYLVRYMGDDFPFIQRLILFFFYFPIALLLISRILIYPFRKRNLILFFIAGLACDYLANDIGFSFFNRMSHFRETISSGQFLFLITLFLGIHFWYLSKSEIAPESAHE